MICDTSNIYWVRILECGTVYEIYIYIFLLVTLSRECLEMLVGSMVPVPLDGDSMIPISTKSLANSSHEILEP